MKQRFVLCILIASALVVMAFPRLSLDAAGIEGLFAVAWISFASIVILANILGLLYSSRTKSRNFAGVNRRVQRREKLRSYSR